MTTVSQAVAQRAENGQPATTAASLAIQPYQDFWTAKQQAALTALGIKGASNADLAVFMHYCQKTGLDPFSRQIYFIKRRVMEDGHWMDKWTIQVGIDGFRVIRDRVAERLSVTVEYEDTIWYDADGGEHKVWLWDQPPTACRVVVLKDGRRFPGVVKFSAYAATKDGKLISQWRTQPDHMIEKCAEAFALRRAFPHDLGGMYAEEELQRQPEPQRRKRPVQAIAEPVEEPMRSGPGQQEHGGSEQAPAEPQASEPAARKGHVDQGEQGINRPAQAGKPALAKLGKLLHQIPLGTTEDRDTLLEWLAGGPFTGTRTQVQQVTGFLEDHLNSAQGDAAAAASNIWDQYRRAVGQAGEPEGGGSDA